MSGILPTVSRDQEMATIQFRARWLVALVAVPLLLQFVIPSRAWVALLIGMGGAMGLGYFWARQMAEKVSLTREQHYGWVHVGDLLEERFTLRNDAFLPALWVEIDDRSDLPGYTARSVRSADGHQAVHWRTEGICKQRGLFTLGPWRAHLSDPFGFFQVTLVHPQTRSILVYPPVIHMPALRLP
jgi:uncharacterized protein (DUF58 family)